MIPEFTPTTPMCGNCQHYERVNAWSGLCNAAAVPTSPGRPCHIEPMQFQQIKIKDAQP